MNAHGVSLGPAAFVEFLLTGSIGGVSVGTAEAVVAERLGSPPETTTIRPGIVVWAYGGRVLQVTLQQGRVVLLGIYLPHARGRSPDLLNGYVPLEAGADRRSFIGEMERLRVPHRECRDNAGAYELGDGAVVAVFGEDGRLQSLQVSRPPDIVSGMGASR